jgi:16S rRNA processing protein RimM
MVNENSSRKICVGQFAGAHGVRGLVKLRSFTEIPETLFDYTPVTTEDGARTFKLTFKSAAKDTFIAQVEGINNKEDADALRGDKLYIARDILPKTRKGEYYEVDLLGLMALDPAGKTYGKVLAVHNHGAGTFLEIGTSKTDSFMLPFKNDFVPEQDFDDGKITILVPEGWP